MVSDINVKGTNHKIGGTQADGQWVRKDVTVFSGTTFSATGTPTYTVSNYLPDDIYTYEVIICSYTTTGSTAGDSNTWWVGDTDVHFVQNMGYSRTRTASHTWSAGEGVIPVKQINGTLYLKLNITSVGSGTGNNGLYLRGYRRLGGASTPQTYYTLTINPTPADATVTFNKGAIVGNTCTVAAGTSVTYTVSKSEYTTQSATVTVDSNKTVNVSLVYAPYSPNQVLYESSTGGASSTLNLKVAGKYQVICVAGGGNGHARSLKISSSAFHTYYTASGGSGSGFNCVFQLSAGSYAISVGSGGANSATAKNDGGDSRFGTCYARGGKGSDIRGETAGAGGASPTLTYTRTTTTLNTAGNAGSKKVSSEAVTVNGGAAVYSSYGKGANARFGTTMAGTAGYVKVIYKGA